MDLMLPNLFIYFSLIAFVSARLPKDNHILTKGLQKMTKSWKPNGADADKICPHQFTYELWMNNLRGFAENILNY